MSNKTSYLLLIYVFGVLERVVVTFNKDFLNSKDIQFYKEPDIVEKISSALPQSWSDLGKDILDVTKLDYVFPNEVNELRNQQKE